MLCSIAALPGAWIYAWLAVHLPFALHLLVALLFALWLGWIAKYAAEQAKVRNPRWMGKLGALIGLVGWYCQWAAYSAFLLQDSHMSGTSLVQSFTDSLARPHYIVGVAAGLFEAGVGVFGGFRIAGWVLAMAWLAELWLLLGFPHLFGRNQAGEPFCESSNSWAEKIELPYKFAFVDNAHDVAQSLRDDFEQLSLVLKPWSEGGPRSYAKVTLYRCRGGGDAYISITNTAVVSTKGKVEETGRLVTDLLRFPGHDPEEVIRQYAQPAPGETDSPGMPTGPSAPELSEAIENLEAERYEAALDSAAPHVIAPDRGLRVDAVRLSALATARLGRWNESRSFWVRLFDEEPTAHNALQVATASVMAGDVARGEEWIVKAKEINTVSQDVSGMLILTNFVTALTQSGQMNVAMRYLDEIKACYESLGMTDPTYLYIRKVPLFSAFLDNSKPVIRAALGQEQGKAWYTSMLPHLDDNGREELNGWLASGFTQQ
jgi:hypothetical protein